MDDPPFVSLVDQAADIILESTWMNDGLRINPVRTAQALADAGLLVTAEIQDVLDAVGAGYEGHPFSARALDEAWRTYLASKGQ